MRKLFIALAIAVFGAGSAGAATDVAAAAQGTGTLKYSTVTCTAPLAVTFNVRSNQAAVTETWGSGNPGVEACAIGMLTFQYEADTTPYPPVQQCLPGISISTGAPFTLNQSGSTYTLQSTYRLCNGKQVVDRIVVTVQPARLVYAHTLTEAGVTLVNVSANLPRLA
ncbi:MAG TPA: hypothetical protein VGB64_13810 [Actinomycetota bacterium]